MMVDVEYIINKSRIVQSRARSLELKAVNYSDPDYLNPDLSEMRGLFNEIGEGLGWR